MQKADTLIRTKLRPPFTRSELVPRSRLQARIALGLRGPLTLVTAPAGFGKTTLVASSITACGMPVAWLSLDKDDNQVERFLSYLVAALQEADPAIGVEAARLLEAARQAPPEAVLTGLINDLDTHAKETVLVLDDYQFIISQAVHAGVAFILEHCPQSFHLVIATRSDPPLPLARLRGRGQVVELRAADLSFTEPEAAQFLNGVMGLHLDPDSIAALAGRTEGWIAGLQMASLAMHSHSSLRDPEDVREFIQGFSGTNRYILDYLLGEVLAGQPPEIQHFLLYTSILERLTAPLCNAVLLSDAGAKEESDGQPADSSPSFHGQSASILEYLEQANLFLVPLDDARTWYRYHHLFADLLHTQLQRSLGPQGVAQLHVRASEWHRQNGSILEAINHASLASDDERVERFIEQSYMEILSRGEQSLMRLWAGKLSKELVYRRPWLCIYEAHSHAWFGELDEADRLLEAAEKLIHSGVSIPEARAMQGHLAYVKSRVTAMRGDLRRAIEYCLVARADVPDSNLSLQFNTRVTLGYEYFLIGDYANASQILNEAIQAGIASGAIIYTVAAYCFVARMYAVQGLLHKSYDTYQIAGQLIREAREEHRDAWALVEIGIADVLCEWNDLEAALAHVKHGLSWLPYWGKADDMALAYLTLARIQLAQANRSGAQEALENALHHTQTSGVFSEARHAGEVAQVKLWLALGDFQAVNHWAALLEDRFGSHDPFGFENELAHIAQARVLIAQNRHNEAILLLSELEAAAWAGGRSGQVIEILLLQALARQEIGDLEQAIQVLAKCLALAEPEGYARIFLDEGQPVQRLLLKALAHASTGPWRGYALRLLSQFKVEPGKTSAVQEKASPAGGLVEPLTGREVEILQLIALGRTNQEIARQLIVSPGTIKAHTASIYRKLDVANRTEAAARARQLGLLP